MVGSNRQARLVAAALAVTFVAGACSGDDDDTFDTTATTEARATPETTESTETTEPAVLSEAEMEAILQDAWLTDEQAQLPVDPEYDTGMGLDPATYSWCDREDDGGDSLRVARAQQSWEEPVDVEQSHAVYGLSTEIVLYDSADGAQRFLDAFAAVPTCPAESSDVGTGQFSEEMEPPGVPEGSVTIRLEKSFFDGTPSLFVLLTAIPVGDLVGILYVQATDLANAGIATADLTPILAANLEAANAALGG